MAGARLPYQPTVSRFENNVGRGRGAPQVGRE